MSILPVLDLLGGQVVRGVAGWRENYRPIVSNLAPSADPVAIALALRDHFGFTELYLADLDAIQHGRPNLGIYQQLTEKGFHLWIDAGLRTADDACLDSLMALPNSVIVGLESIAGPEGLLRTLNRVGVERAVFSLDLKAGVPMGAYELWPSPDVWGIADHALGTLGVQRLIVLDLTRVGVGAGVGTEELCTRIKQSYPDAQLTAGGGVRGIDDVHRLTSIGVDRVLVASALHDGRITPGALKRA